MRLHRPRLAGQCFDNAAMESFWARMQVELLNTRKWATTYELAAAMADYIDNFYNVERRHSYLGNISPQSSKRSGDPPIRSLSSHNHGSKWRGQITWINRSGSGQSGSDTLSKWRIRASSSLHCNSSETYVG